MRRPYFQMPMPQPLVGSYVQVPRCTRTHPGFETAKIYGTLLRRFSLLSPDTYASRAIRARYFRPTPHYNVRWLVIEEQTKEKFYTCQCYVEVLLPPKYLKLCVPYLTFKWLLNELPRRFKNAFVKRARLIRGFYVFAAPYEWAEDILLTEADRMPPGVFRRFYEAVQGNDNVIGYKIRGDRFRALPWKLLPGNKGCKICHRGLRREGALLFKHSAARGFKNLTEVPCDRIYTNVARFS